MQRINVIFLLHQRTCYFPGNGKVTKGKPFKRICYFSFAPKKSNQKNVSGEVPNRFPRTPNPRRHKRGTAPFWISPVGGECVKKGKQASD